MQQADISRIGFTDLTNPDVLDNPYPLYQRLRREDPVHQDPSGKGWIVSRYDDIEKVLADKRFSSERSMSAQEREQAGISEAVLTALSRMMVFMDPPNHTRLRGLFTKAFTPSRMEALKPQVAAMVRELLREAQQRGATMDFIQDFAVPLPVTVIAQLLGVPVADWPPLREWSVALGRILGGRVLTPQESAEAQVGVMKFVGYFAELIAERRKQPAGDMISGLIQVEEQGDRLSTEELIVNLILLMAAGHGTTTHLLGNGLLALSRQPDQWQFLVANPAVTPNAVNELLRFDGPVQATGRQALDEATLGNRTLPKGTRVMVLLGSANRDESRFPEPDRLDLQRPGVRPLSFGHGIHTCLGAALARMEAQVAFSELASSYPRIAISGTPQRNPSSAFRGLLSLPVALNG
jgi:cytochrome P450